MRAMEVRKLAEPNALLIIRWEQRHHVQVGRGQPQAVELSRHGETRASTILRV